MHNEISFVSNELNTDNEIVKILIFEALCSDLTTIHFDSSCNKIRGTTSMKNINDAEKILNLMLLQLKDCKFSFCYLNLFFK